MRYCDYISFKDIILFHIGKMQNSVFVPSDDVERSPIFKKCRIPGIFSGYTFEIQLQISKIEYQNKEISSSCIKDIKREIPQNLTIIKESYRFLGDRLSRNFYVYVTLVFDDKTFYAAKLLGES